MDTELRIPRRQVLDIAVTLDALRRLVHRCRREKRRISEFVVAPDVWRAIAVGASRHPGNHFPDPQESEQTPLVGSLWSIRLRRDPTLPPGSWRYVSAETGA